MKKLFKAEEFLSQSGSYHVICNDLVGSGRNWIEPAKILGIKPTEFILLLKNEFNADVMPYKKDGKVSWVGYSWSKLSDCRKYKNYINKRARETSYYI